MKKYFLIILFIFSFLFANVYDGLWFMGFNLDRDVFKGEQGKVNRLYVAAGLDLDKIQREVFPEEKIARSFIYPVSEYNQELITGNIQFKSGKKNLKLRTIVLLHSDGIKSQKAAQLIAGQLASQNIKVKLQKIDNTKYNSWEEALKSKDYDLFLMGFKADYQKSVITFLLPLYGSNGYANFMGYKNPVVDKLLKEIDANSHTANETVLKLLDKNLNNDLPLLPIFYIEQIN